MSLAQHMYNMVAIIANYAVKEHYTGNGADYEHLEEIEKTAKALSKYSNEYELVYKYAEEVQEYIMNKSKRGYRRKG